MCSKGEGEIDTNRCFLPQTLTNPPTENQLTHIIVGHPFRELLDSDVYQPIKQVFIETNSSTRILTKEDKNLVVYWDMNHYFTWFAIEIMGGLGYMPFKF